MLTGAPSLEQALAGDSTLVHHVDVKVRLEPLDPTGAAAYLANRIDVAGGNPAILDPGAVAALHALGRGLPGRMNTLADNALFEAFLCGRAKMTRTDVERACRDLGLGAPEAGAAPEAPQAVEESFDDVIAEANQEEDEPEELEAPLDDEPAAPVPPPRATPSRSRAPASKPARKKKISFV